MLIPVSLVINNFRSIIDEHLIFDNGKTYLLQGINLTDTGVESNGSGKSSFREALAYVLGLPIYCDTISDVINNDSDSVLVSFTFKNNITNEVISITRSNSLKGGTQLQIEINSINQSDKFATIPEGDKLIVKLLGLPKEDILNHFIISKEKFVSFLSSSDNDKKNLINRFSGANKIDGIDKLIQKDISVKEKEKQDIEDIINKRKGSIETYQNEIEELIASNDPNEINEEVENKKFKVIELEKKVEDTEKLITSDKNRVALLTETNENLEEDKVRLEREIQLKEKLIEPLSKQVKDLEKETKEFNNFLSELNTSLAGVISCPNCSFEFNPGDGIDVNEARDTVSIVENNISELSKKITSINLNIDKANDFLDELDEKIADCDDKIKSNNSEIRTLNYGIKSNNSIIESTKSLIISLNNEIEALITNDIQKEIDVINNKIALIETEILELTEKSNNISDEIFTLNQWIVRFVKFKSHLANKSLSIIQGYTNLYLNKMRTNLGVRIEGYKQNKDNSIKEKINLIILRDGMVEGSGSFKKFSGGERCRINISTTLAMRELINQASPTGGLDLFWIDEITEGLDSVGIELVASSINELGITSILTSHVKHEKTYEYVLTAVKENKITRLLTSNN